MLASVTLQMTIRYLLTEREIILTHWWNTYLLATKCKDSYNMILPGATMHVFNFVFWQKCHLSLKWKNKNVWWEYIPPRMWPSAPRSYSYEDVFPPLEHGAIMIYDCKNLFKLRFVWLSVSIKGIIIIFFPFPNKCSTQPSVHKTCTRMWQWLISVAEFFISNN